MNDARRLLTVMFTDIESSSRLWEQHGARMAAAVARHDTLVRAAVHEHRGSIVKMLGDGAHAVFADPCDALLASLQLLRAVGDPSSTADVPLRIRCGVHAGIVECRDNDYFGTVVNRAARLASAAHGGQLLVSRAVVELAGGRLPPDVSLRDLGNVRLRDLASPEHVYQLLHADLRREFPPLRSLEATPNNLPQQVTSFIGHAVSRVEVRRLLATARLLTLVGMGGLGKSRLSLQVATEVLDDFADGVWLVELAAIADARRVPEAVASVLGVVEDPGRSVREALLRYVKDRQLLVILDNCEHLIDACAELAKALLTAGPRITIMASSREPLRITGEVIYPMPALSLPKLGASVDVALVQQCDAVHLFTERAAAVQRHFAITPHNAPAVADICRRLDGIPLAIELAAARSNVLSVETIAARLHDRLGLLTRGGRAVAPRQRTLRALIDWSYDLLDENEKALFARLAVFAGSMTIDAVEAVGVDAETDSPSVFDLLVALVEKSLVECDAGRERYRMLETVREYAQQRLEATPDSAKAARTRHVEYFVDLAERARPELWGPAQGEWLKRLDPDRDNFLAALEFCERIDRGAEQGLKLVYALQLYWLPRGLIELGYRLTVEALSRQGAELRDLNRSGAQYAACQLAYFMGRYENARDHAQECLAIAREFGIRERAASALLLLGYAANALGERVAAKQHFEESAALARELGDKSRLSFALNALAGHYQERNDLVAAEPLFEEALALARELGDQETIAIGLPNLARLLVEKGDRERVPGLLCEGLAIAQAIGFARGKQIVLEVAADLAVLRGEWRRAARLFGSAEAQLESMGLKRTPEDDAVLRRWIAQAREALGNDAFAASECEGRALPYEDAIDDARQWLEGGS